MTRPRARPDASGVGRTIDRPPWAGDPSKIDEATRRHYAKQYAEPGAMRAAFAQFNTIAARDVADNIGYE